jgi:D,D-heptose 1,7-bisphosphate phosphatase
MIQNKSIYSYDSPEYVKDIGTPHRFLQVEKDIKLKKLSRKNLINKQRAVFLDRDGTINKYVGFLKNIDDFELLPGVSNAIKKINNMGYLVIVITNQPVIARGDLNWNELNEIHNKMETLLGFKGAYIDGIFICPHHPDSGFISEIKEYKIDCSCRKPKHGLFIDAAEKYNIDLSKSIMIGDSDVDMVAGKKAGCRTYRYNSKQSFDNFFSKINLSY